MMATMIPTTLSSSLARPRLVAALPRSFAPVPRRAPSSRVCSSLSGGAAAGGGDSSNDKRAPWTSSFSKASNDKSATGSGVDAAGGSSSERSGKSGSSSSSYAAEAEAWSRVQLLRARLREATSQEDYSAATKLRDTLALAVDALPLSQRHVLAALDTASSSSSSLDRASALLRAADHVRPYAFAQLAFFLHDSDDSVSAAAERALATAFRAPPDEAAAARMDEGDAALEQAAMAGAMGGGSGGERRGERSGGRGPPPPRRRSALSRAVAAYSGCAELYPEFAEAHNAKATALYVAGDPEGSLRACEVVLDLNPWHFSCAAGAGMCFIALGKHEEALACLEVALEINPRLEHVAATAARMRKNNSSSSSSSPSSSPSSFSSSSSSTARGRLPWQAAREAAARARAEQQE